MPLLLLLPLHRLAKLMFCQSCGTESPSQPSAGSTVVRRRGGGLQQQHHTGCSRWGLMGGCWFGGGTNSAILCTGELDVCAWPMQLGSSSLLQLAAEVGMADH
jgi:hypothetical protein